LIFKSNFEQLVFTQVGKEVAVFDRVSGRSHLISEESFVILEVTKNPETQEGLCKRVLSTFEVESHGDPSDGVKARLDELVRLGLVHGVHS
jgi:PqqD family protein of HPr-rel-A system